MNIETEKDALIETMPTPLEIKEMIDAELVQYVDITSYAPVISEMHDKGLSWAKIHRFLCKKGVPCKYDQVVYVGKARVVQRDTHQKHQDEEQDAIIESQHGILE